MTEPPARRKGPRLRRGRLQSGEVSRQSKQTDRKIANQLSDSKSKRPSALADAHLPGYLRFFARELRGRDLGTTSRKFFAEAKVRFKQFSRSGDPDLRRLTWSAIQLCADHLEKKGHESGA